MDPFLLTPMQEALLAALAGGLTWFLTVVWSGVLGQPKPGETFLKGLVFVVAVGFGYFWSGATVPVFSGDLVGFAVALLAQAVLAMKAAQVVYDVLWKPLLGGLTSRAKFLSFLLPAR